MLETYLHKVCINFSIADAQENFGWYLKSRERYTKCIKNPGKYMETAPI